MEYLVVPKYTILGIEEVLNDENKYQFSLRNISSKGQVYKISKVDFLKRVNPENKGPLF